MNNTKLTYHGMVELIKVNKKGRIIGKKTFKNKGYNSLFTIFAKALVGVYDNQYIPTNVTLEYITNNSTTTQISSSPISGLVYIETPGNDIGVPHAKLTSFIPYSPQLSNLGENDRLILTLRSRQRELADLDITDSDVTSLSEGQSFILNWYLYIDNIPQTTIPQEETAQEEQQTEEEVEQQEEDE